MIDAATLGRRLDALRRRIEAAGGDPGSVRVLPVTKGFDAGAVTAALAAGCEEVGENYAQELLGKAAALDAAGGGAPRWHFLGRVQRNKVARLAPTVDCWQGLARAVEGESIARHRPTARVMVEVETTGEARRNGCPVAAVPTLVADLVGLGLWVEGLMTVAPATDDVTAVRRSFRAVRDLADRLGLPQRSMGMTDDLELAVQEGSTMVRVGRALFGDRPAPPGGGGSSGVTAPG
jgi:pyridoxal phosphate enzyme (YggS family)